MIHPFVLTIFSTAIWTVLHLSDFSVYGFLLAVCFGTYMMFWLLEVSRYPHIHTVLICIILSMTIFFVSYVFEKREHTYGLGFSEFETANLEGTITEFPEYRFSNNQYVVTLYDSSTTVLVYTRPHEKFSYLETLEFSAQLIDVRTEEETFQEYYRSLGVHYISFYPTIIKKVAQEESVNEFSPSIFQTYKAHIFTLKMYLREKIVTQFSSYASALMLGILLGEKDALSKEEKEMFNTASLSHILVVSGYNISILIAFVYFLLKKTRRAVRFTFSIVLIFMFVTLVGYSAAVVRAALMGSVFVFSKLVYRSSSAINILLCVASALILYNPRIVFDIGFHLSCIATFGLLLMPSDSKIPDVLRSTFYAQLFVNPYLLYMAGAINSFALGSNILVIPFLPIYMLLAFILIVLPGHALVFGFMAGLYLLIESMSRYTFVISQAFSHTPLFTFTTTPHSIYVVYIVLFFLIVFLKNRYTTEVFIDKHYQRFFPQRSN